MLARETGGEEETTTTPFNIPEEVLSVLPSDPFEQLDVARKITSIALSTRISSLESESSALQEKLAEKDDVIADLTSQLHSFDTALSDVSDRLAQAELDKENLLKENASLSSAVKKLQRDVSKLEIFRKTLMQSLKEDEESPVGVPQIIAKPTSTEEGTTLPPSRYSSIRSDISDIGNSFVEDRLIDASKPAISQSIFLASQTSTPKLTPPGSPPTLSASVSPTRTSKPVSPRRHSMSFSTTRGIPDDRSFIFSSMPSSQPSSMSSFDSGSNAGRTRVDGKEFFRQVRSRLSHEQFIAFLANVKELNSHKQTKEETLRRADEIFGPDNKDLYAIFEGLITRNIH